MRRVASPAVGLCLLAFVVTLYGCGGSGGPTGPSESTAAKPKPPPAHVSYTITDLGTFSPWEINAAGQVAGAITVGTETHAAHWTGGAPADLGLAPFSRGYAVSDLGVVAGPWQDASRVMRAFVWQAGETACLEPLEGSPASLARGVNDSLQVAGDSYQPEQTLPEDRHACLWEKDLEGTWGVTDLGALAVGYALSSAAGINSAGQVVGYVSNSGGAPQASLWSGESFMALGTLGGASSGATAVGDMGLVVGGSATADGKTHAFLWQQGTGMQDLGTLSSTYTGSGALDVNAAATPQIVGNSYYFKVKPSPGTYVYRACLWEGGKVYDLNSYLVPDGNTWVLQNAITVNAAGQIVAGGTCNGSIRYGLLTPQ